jgi:hypothetical protein
VTIQLGVIVALIGAVATIVASMLSPVAARLEAGSGLPQNGSNGGNGAQAGTSSSDGDVSTMAAGKRFYARPDFSSFPSCGRPCWLPIFPQTTESTQSVTQNWPCEYYNPQSDSSSCGRPPHRTQSQMWDPADPNSADRLLVVCQVRNGEDIRNANGQASAIWDAVAVPRSELVSTSALTALPAELVGAAGFYEAFAPDIWLGDSGWHKIQCR